MRFVAPILFLLNTLLIHGVSAQNFCKSGRGDAMRDADATALDPRSDSINIRHYTINLDFSEMPQPGIKATCTVDFEALVNGISNITLDLEGLLVDSVMQGQTEPFGSFRCYGVLSRYACRRCKRIRGL
jgi:hypothetical protein